MVPGIGTAASVGIDALLATRDISKAGTGVGRSEHGSTATEAKAAESMTASKEPSDTETASLKMQQELLATLNELKTYLKGVNGQNDELAKATHKAADNIEKTTRISGYRNPVVS